jgi:hypothetical protein
MVLQEGAKKCSILAGGLHRIDAIDEIADTPTSRLECLGDPVVSAERISP